MTPLFYGQKDADSQVLWEHKFAEYKALLPTVDEWVLMFAATLSLYPGHSPLDDLCHGGTMAARTNLIFYNQTMKSFFSRSLLALALLGLPLVSFALDPHDAQSINALSTQGVTTTTPQTITLLTLTTHAVNSGTNSYFIWATVKFDLPLGGDYTLQLANAGTAIASTVIRISGQGYVTLMTEVESLAVSTALTLQVVCKNSGDPYKFPTATLMINGQAGATQ